MYAASAGNGTAQTFVYDGYNITYNVTDSWDSTETVNISIKNTGAETIENWMLYFAPNGAVDPNNIWNACTATTESGITYFRNTGYNSAIQPNASVNFSYFVNDCTEIPESYVLCQKKAEASADKYSVSVVEYGNWDDHFNGAILLANNSDEEIRDWELTFDTSFTITEISDSWAGTAAAQNGRTEII